MFSLDYPRGIMYSAKLKLQQLQLSKSIFRERKQDLQINCFTTILDKIITFYVFQL